MTNLNFKTFSATIDEVVVDAEDLKIVRYHTEQMRSASGVLYMNPLIQLKKVKTGWKAYFLDNKYEDYDFPIFESKGISVTFD